ncbi:MAG: hypothetical protein MJ209_01280, partial [archaeon]|nr:hypothetical protein [archaeon]
NSNFINGTAFYTGGGITFSDGNNLLIDNCSFVNNSFPQYGGALLLRGNNVVANHCVFYNNEASLGGAIQSSGINNTVVNSIFDGNKATNGQSVAYKLATNFNANENYGAMDYITDEDFIASDLLSFYFKDLNNTHIDVSTAPDNWILMNINPLSKVVYGEPAYFEAVFDTLTDGFNMMNYKRDLPDYKTLIVNDGVIFDLIILQGKNGIFKLIFPNAGENRILAVSPISGLIESFYL